MILVSRPFFNLVVLVICFFFVCNSVFAQKQGNIWYFGYNAGIDFNSGKARVVTDGAIKTLEGCATIADTTGRLLFYTDGVTVWNKKHLIMQNGKELGGNFSSTQSAVIVPLPENNNKYYVFTVDQLGGENGLMFSIVDMQMDAGLGAVVQKNSRLIAPVAEKLSAVKHSNNVDYWIVTHQWGGNAFYAYKLTANGLDDAPVISRVGVDYDFYNGVGNTLGQLKISSQGNKIALLRSLDKICELFDFDASTGLVSNSSPVLCLYNWPYGAEFSADGMFLYITTLHYVLQYNLENHVQGEILHQNTIIGHNEEEQYSGIQLAPDGRIYVAKHPTHTGSSFPIGTHLAVIQRPNEPDENCRFIEDGLFLQGAGSQLGLPAIVQSWYEAPFFYVNNFCFGDTTFFESVKISGIDSVIWHFGDTINTTIAKGYDVKHYYTNSGTYLVSAYIHTTSKVELVQREIEVHPLVDFSLGNDTIICGDKFYEINALFADSVVASNLQSFIWNDSIDDVFMLGVTQSGVYRVQALSLDNCLGTDSVSIRFAPLAIPPFFSDTTICRGESVVYSTSENYISYLWQDSVTSRSYSVDKEGDYHLMVLDTNFCSAEAFFSVFVNDKPQISIFAPTDLCNLAEAELRFEGQADGYFWSTGESLSSIFVSSSGVYTLDAWNECGHVVDSVVLQFELCDPEIPNVVTPNTPFNIKKMGSLVWDLQVFNRWGTKVFSEFNYELTNFDFEKKWTGTNDHGQSLSPGVYYYVLTNTKFKKQYTGFVHVYN